MEDPDVPEALGLAGNRDSSWTSKTSRIFWERDPDCDPCTGNGHVARTIVRPDGAQRRSRDGILPTPTRASRRVGSPGGNLTMRENQWWRDVLAIGGRRSCARGHHRRLADCPGTPEPNNRGTALPLGRSRDRDLCTASDRDRCVCRRNAGLQLLPAPALQHIHDCRSTELGGVVRVRRRGHHRQSALCGGPPACQRSRGAETGGHAIVRSQS